MTEEELENIKQKRKWPITFSDFFKNYFFLIFPFAIVFIGYFQTKTGFEKNIENLKLSGFVAIPYPNFCKRP